MSIFDIPVRDWMSPPLHTVGPDVLLPAVARILEDAGISGLPVVDAEMRPLGVLSRTDLLHQGASPRVTGTAHSSRQVPDRRAGDVIAGTPICVQRDASLAEAVRHLRDARIHRVLVLEGERLVGIVSPWDVMRLVATSDLSQPIDTLMSGSVVTVPADAPTQSAIERLNNAHVHGLVVLDGDWPVGIFGQDEALAAERWPDPTQVDQWQSASLVALPSHIPVHRAAAQAVATRCRHIVVMNANQIGGVVTPWDFVRVDRC